MDWDKLKAFYAVADAGSFTHAANVLHLTQPSISRKIGALEEELRTPLFHRHATGLVLTEQGELLYNTVTGIFTELSDVEQTIKESKDNEEGELTITASEMVAKSWLFPMLPIFIKEYPDIQIRIIETDTLLNLDKREADVAIRLLPPTQQDLIQKKLRDVKFSLVASNEYIEKYGIPEKVQDLKGHTLIAYPHSTQVPLPEPNWHLPLANIDINTHKKKIISNSFSGTLSFIKAGCGIGTLNEHEIEKNSDLVKIFPDTIQNNISVYFVYASGRKRSRKIKTLQTFLQKSMMS